MIELITFGLQFVVHVQSNDYLDVHIDELRGELRDQSSDKLRDKSRGSNKAYTLMIRPRPNATRAGGVAVRLNRYQDAKQHPRRGPRQRPQRKTKPNNQIKIPSRVK